MAEPLAAQVAPPSKAARIGVLTLRRREDTSPTNTALFQGFRDFGYIDGRNVVVEWPDAQGRQDRLPELAAELVRKQVDVILVIGPAPLPAARNATSTIPLVMVASSNDPVAEGVAASLARPGGNVTGLAYGEPDRIKKTLEVLKTAAPNARQSMLLRADRVIR